MNDELRLIRRIQKKGDRAAADTLVRMYYNEIFRFMKKQIYDDDMAFDLTQEVFISVLKTIYRYDPKKGAGFRTWLYKIATDKTVDYFRSSSARRTETLSFDAPNFVDGTAVDGTAVDGTAVCEADFTRRLEDRDFTERVCAFIGGLPPETQKIFRLHIFGGYTFAEIANDTKLAESSVKSKYYRLLGTLRKEFGSYDR